MTPTLVTTDTAIFKNKERNKIPICFLEYKRMFSVCDEMGAPKTACKKLVWTLSELHLNLQWP